MLPRSSHLRRAARQRGAALFVALVVLVALALSALALLRSTDVAGLLAGNLSFKESALNATDLGYQQAQSLFPTSATTADSPANCFSSTQLDVDSRGVPSLLNATSTFDSTYTACKLTVSGTGEVVRFFTDRLCARTSVALVTDCSLAHKLPPGAWVGGSAAIPTAGSTFRVTVRVDGPRGTTAYTQFIGRQ